MWDIRKEALKNSRGFRFFIDLKGQPAAFNDVIHGWMNDPAFRSFFNAALAEAPFTAYQWETPPVTLDRTSRPFEFVVLDSPMLDRRPDPAPFSEHFQQSPGKDILVFPNLGGDAMMIVPRLKTKISAYGHLAAFVREAPEAQRHLLWQKVGQTMSQHLDDGTPVWLNTAGGGVRWLHVRLDDRPKYYLFEPYRGMD